MSTELTFARPGGIEIVVEMSAGKRLYIRIRQTTGKGFEARCHILASTLSVRPDACELLEHEGRWTLDIGDTGYFFEPDEARQLQETFGLQVRHIPARPAS